MMRRAGFSIYVTSWRFGPLLERPDFEPTKALSPGIAYGKKAEFRRKAALPPSVSVPPSNYLESRAFVHFATSAMLESCVERVKSLFVCSRKK